MGCARNQSAMKSTNSRTLRTVWEVLAAHRPEEEDVWAVYPNRRHVPSKVKLAIEHMQQEFKNRPPMMPTRLST